MVGEYMVILYILAAVVFYYLRSAETNTLIAILIFAVIGVGAYVHYYVVAPPGGDRRGLEDIKGRMEAVSTSFEVKKFPSDSKFKFIGNNAALQDIAKDLRFMRIFDKARYGDLLVHMDKLQKIYMYILADRYHPTTHIPIFMDLRAAVLEILYGLVHVVPSVLKHTYGIDPYVVIQRNIDEFTSLSRKMATVLQAFCKDQGHIFPDAYYHPYEHGRKNILP